MITADIFGLDMSAVETIVGLIVGLIAIGGLVWGAFLALRSRLGRRQRKYAQLQRLSAGTLLSVFRSTLGSAPALTEERVAEIQAYDDQGKPYPVEKTLRQHFFVDPDFYVQAVCDEAEKVLAFSVTTRSKKFRPTFEFPPKPNWRERRRRKKQWGYEFKFLHQVTLGETRLAALDGTGMHIKAACGARTWSYSEAYYYGNPGYYQHYAFTASSAVAVGEVGEILNVARALGRHWVGLNAEQVAGNQLLTRFRDTTTITTYTVLGPHLRLEDYPLTFGPHGDEVRVLAG